MESSATLLVVFAFLVLLLALFGLLVAYNFIRYRFKGDRTYQFIGLFGLMFILVVIFSVVQVRFSETPAEESSNNLEFDF